jgi:hypothetical protein
VLTYVVWGIVGVALVVLLAPALVCSTLLVPATLAVTTTAPWRRIDRT